MTALRRMTGKGFGAFAAAMALGLASPALAQNASEAPVDVTAAPSNTGDSVGPAQLRNFSLGGTSTRPSTGNGDTATPVPSSRPAPASATSEPRTDTATVTEAPTRSADRVRPAAAAPSAGNLPPSAAAPNAGSSTGTFGNQEPTPAASSEVVAPSEPVDLNPAPVAPSASGSASLWPWLAALIAAVLAIGAVWFMKRGRTQRYADPGRLAFAGPSPDVDVPPAAPPRHLPPRQAAPSPTPTPAASPAPKPKPSDDGLIVSRGMRPELTVQFQPDRLVISESEAILQFDITIQNSGSAPARDVLIEAVMVTAHAGQDGEISRFFQNPVGQGDRIAAIPPLGRLALKSAVRLPIEQVHRFQVEERQLFVPLVALNLLYRHGSGNDQASASFLVGRGTNDDNKLAPFRLDLGPRIFRGLSARPHSAGLQR